MDPGVDVAASHFTSARADRDDAARQQAAAVRGPPPIAAGASPPRRGNDRTITSHTLDDFRASLQQQSQQRGKENKIRPAGPKLWNSSANWEE